MAREEKESERKENPIDQHEGDMHNGELGGNLHQMPPVEKEASPKENTEQRTSERAENKDR